MKEISNWSTRRSGRSLTIYGTDSDGKTVKIVGVETIRSVSPHPVARDQNGNEYLLLPAEA